MAEMDSFLTGLNPDDKSTEINNLVNSSPDYIIKISEEVLAMSERQKADLEINTLSISENSKANIGSALGKVDRKYIVGPALLHNDLLSIIESVENIYKSLSGNKDNKPLSEADTSKVDNKKGGKDNKSKSFGPALKANIEAIKMMTEVNWAKAIISLGFYNIVKTSIDKIAAKSKSDSKQYEEFAKSAKSLHQAFAELKKAALEGMLFALIMIPAGILMAIAIPGLLVFKLFTKLSKSILENSFNKKDIDKIKNMQTALKELIKAAALTLAVSAILTIALPFTIISLLSLAVLWVFTKLSLIIANELGNKTVQNKLAGMVKSALLLFVGFGALSLAVLLISKVGKPKVLLGAILGLVGIGVIVGLGIGLGVLFAIPYVSAAIGAMAVGGLLLAIGFSSLALSVLVLSKIKDKIADAIEGAFLISLFVLTCVPSLIVLGDPYIVISATLASISGVAMLIAFGTLALSVLIIAAIRPKLKAAVQGAFLISLFSIAIIPAIIMIGNPGLMLSLIFASVNAVMLLVTMSFISLAVLEISALLPRLGDAILGALDISAFMICLIPALMVIGNVATLYALSIATPNAIMLFTVTSLVSISVLELAALSKKLPAAIKGAFNLSEFMLCLIPALFLFGNPATLYALSIATPNSLLLLATVTIMLAPIAMLSGARELINGAMEGAMMLSQFSLELIPALALLGSPVLSVLLTIATVNANALLLFAPLLAAGAGILGAALSVLNNAISSMNETNLVAFSDSFNVAMIKINDGISKISLPTIAKLALLGGALDQMSKAAQKLKPLNDLADNAGKFTEIADSFDRMADALARISSKSGLIKDLGNMKAPQGNSNNNSGTFSNNDKIDEIYNILSGWNEKGIKTISTVNKQEQNAKIGADNVNFKGGRQR